MSTTMGRNGLHNHYCGTQQRQPHIAASRIGVSPFLHKMTALFVLHFIAVLLAALALWSMRHEITERATTFRDWLMPVILAAASAAVLLIVSPGKRPELWLLCIAVGLAVGVGAGMVLTPVKDFALNLVLIHRSWDGVAVAALLLLLALIRLVTTDITGRQSTGHGVLGGAAVLLAAFLLGRVATLHLYTAPKSIHLDMVRGQRRKSD